VTTILEKTFVNLVSMQYSLSVGVTRTATERHASTLQC